MNVSVDNSLVHVFIRLESGGRDETYQYCDGGQEMGVGVEVGPEPELRATTRLIVVRLKRRGQHPTILSSQLFILFARLKVEDDEEDKKIQERQASSMLLLLIK